MKEPHQRWLGARYMKSRRARIALVLILMGYLVTWTFAPPLARNACVARANRLYSQALEEMQRNIPKELGEDPGKFERIAHPDWPSVETGRAIPILPGILLLYNEYHIGPLYAKGQATYFLFYGFGVLRLVEFTTWIS